MLAKQQNNAKKTQKTDTNQASNLVTKVFANFADRNTQHKGDMKELKIVHVTTFKYEDNKECLLVSVNESGAKNLQRVHVELVKSLESTSGKPCLVIPSRKTVDGKKFSNFIGKKVPRTKTLTYTRELLLEDLLFPATIVGKRTRYPRGQQKQLKVLIDSVDKDTISSKTTPICVAHKSLTGHELSLDFPATS